MKRTIFLAALLCLRGALPSAADPVLPKGWGEGADDKSFRAILSSGFKPAGAVGLDRLDQDDSQRVCSNPASADTKAGQAVREKLQTQAMAAVKWPSDGKFLGDWKEGEKIAQSGRGLTWTDKAGQENGGNCYNCHQIGPVEMSYGTIGPSLLHYGKIRGTSEEVLRYTWAKIYNGKSSNACSNMPRAGHRGILTEKQMQHLMALLLDPASPVNK